MKDPTTIGEKVAHSLLWFTLAILICVIGKILSGL